MVRYFIKKAQHPDANVVAPLGQQRKAQIRKIEQHKITGMDTVPSVTEFPVLCFKLMPRLIALP